jgi:hypothetical protein
MIDGKEQFLELTDKYLPYKALPTTLLGASVLEIPHMSGEYHNVQLRKLLDPARIENSNRFNVEVRITSTEQKYKVKTTANGSTRNLAAQILENPNSSIMKTELNELFQHTMDSKIVVDSVYGIQNTREADQLSYITDLVLSEKLNKIGSYKIWKLPMVMKAYTDDIVSLAERSYPVEYVQYENADVYETEYDVYLDEEGEFVEIPKDKSFAFKGQSYSCTYVKISPKRLKVKIVAKLSLDDIQPEDYPAFKEYVTHILEANEELIGFK